MPVVIPRLTYGLYAQVSAAPFYVRAGFSERGEVFDEAGIPHIEMVRRW